MNEPNDKRLEEMAQEFLHRQSRAAVGCGDRPSLLALLRQVQREERERGSETRERLVATEARLRAYEQADSIFTEEFDRTGDPAAAKIHMLEAMLREVEAEVERLRTGTIDLAVACNVSAARAEKAEARLREEVEAHVTTADDALAARDETRAVQVRLREVEAERDEWKRIAYVESKGNACAWKDKYEKAEAALRLALDAMTDAEKYQRRLCIDEKPHDHALLRKLQATIPSCDAALAVASEVKP